MIEVSGVVEQRCDELASQWRKPRHLSSNLPEVRNLKASTKEFNRCVP